MKRFGLFGLVAIGFVAGMFYVYSCGGGSSSSAATIHYYSLNQWGIPISAYSTFQGSWSATAGLYTATGSGQTYVDAPINLPDGAVVDKMYAYVYDAYGSDSVQVRFDGSAHTSNFLTTIDSVISAGSAGAQILSTTFSSPETVDNLTNGYSIRISLGAAGDNTLGFAAVVFRYTI